MLRVVTYAHGYLSTNICFPFIGGEVSCKIRYSTVLLFYYLNNVYERKIDETLKTNLINYFVNADVSCLINLLLVYLKKN